MECAWIADPHRELLSEHGAHLLQRDDVGRQILHAFRDHLFLQKIEEHSSSCGVVAGYLSDKPFDVLGFVSIRHDSSCEVVVC